MNAAAGRGPGRPGVPALLMSLLWLPLLLGLLVLGRGQQVSPVWLYPVGIVPAVAGWLLFSFRPGISGRTLYAVIVVLVGGGAVLLAGSDGWTAAAGFPMLAALITGMRLPTRTAAVVSGLNACLLVLVVGPYESLWDPVAVIAAVAALMLFGMARRDAARRAEEHEGALVADARAREEHARAEAVTDRARVARDVHDVLAHSLSALAVQLQGARLMALRDGAAEDTVAQIERAQRLASDGIAEARRAVRALREGPGPVDVGAELHTLADAHPDATVHVDPDLRLGGREGETVLRTAQEALSNARKHAPGAPVTVSLRGTGDGAELEVRDSGSGPPAPADGAGSGLVGMAERAALVGAELETGATGDGWRVRLRIPADAGERIVR
ncbi:sensor histidine kinase [Pseudonocardia sp. HH130630-07]|uniref:sensor histidine kinase n=1 Tax=Pseudonocardia sp. HH130630-07 TaxID=1690815 RepID=UPI0008152515|nr:histidine kinase [Pseudonocardia sp. HH130630-07]ANY07538.1 hypothetical protein AFB00_15955 [Pseudonocardia sp. HH130630-07]